MTHSVPASLYREIIQNEDELIRLRRHFHSFPELRWQERKTTDEIKRILTSFGLKPRPLSLPGRSTGLKVCLGKPGSCRILLRFDIDGLPIEESRVLSHLPAKEAFRSEREGFMHACGHDGHIAIGLLTAKLLAGHQDELDGQVTILFQPAEEGGQGALPIAKSGLTDDMDFFLAGHIVPARQYPEADRDFSITRGSFATSKLDAVFHGKAAHAARPEDGCSVMPAIGKVISSLYDLPRVYPGSVLNVGTLKAGSNRNILADSGKLEMEVRAKDTAVNDALTGAAIKTIRTQSEKCGITADVLLTGSAPVLDSSPDLSSFLENIFSAPDMPVKISSSPFISFMASEDAAHLMDAVKAGGGRAAYLLFPAETTALLHQPDYDFDESVLKKALFFYLYATLKLQNRKDALESNDSTDSSI